MGTVISNCDGEEIGQDYTSLCIRSAIKENNELTVENIVTKRDLSVGYWSGLNSQQKMTFAPDLSEVLVMSGVSPLPRAMVVKMLDNVASWWQFLAREEKLSFVKGVVEEFGNDTRTVTGVEASSSSSSLEGSAVRTAMKRKRSRKVDSLESEEGSEKGVKRIKQDDRSVDGSDNRPTDSSDEEFDTSGKDMLSGDESDVTDDD